MTDESKGSTFAEGAPPGRAWMLGCGCGFLAPIANVQMVATAPWLPSHHAIPRFALPALLTAALVVWVVGRRRRAAGKTGTMRAPGPGSLVARPVNQADAMHRAQEPGLAAHGFFPEETTTRAAEDSILEMGLGAALEGNQFSLRFQPEVNLATGAIVCCEVLLRWNHPALGPVSAERFLPIADANGMSLQIGEWVLSAACREARRWQQESQAAVPVAVKVSAAQLNHPGFCAMIERILDEAGLDAKYLEIEVAESVLLAHQDLSFEVFRDLEALGIGIAVDDFGTGYSSLSYLKQFPVRKLKVDRTFVRDIDTNADHAAITAAIIHMAKCLQIDAVAEGVETQEQLARLRGMACDHVQGSLPGEPMVGEAIPYCVRERDAAAAAEISQDAAVHALLPARRAAMSASTLR